MTITIEKCIFTIGVTCVYLQMSRMMQILLCLSMLSINNSVLLWTNIKSYCSSFSFKWIVPVYQFIQILIPQELYRELLSKYTAI